jgi:hypothetical protein
VVGHVFDRNQTRVVKKYFESKPEVEKVINPELRWLQDGENDLREVKAKRWRKIANRRECVFVIKEDKVLEKTAK